MDDFIKDFLEPTPLALARIKESWNVLPFEGKVKILKSLLNIERKGQGGFRYVYQANELKDLALNDDNPYIRYIAAQSVSKPYKWEGREETEEDRADEARYNRILSDDNLLVRSAVERGLGILAKDDDETAKLFWSFSHLKRLITVSGRDPLDRIKGKVFAKVLEYAAFDLLPKNEISILEIIDVISQYTSHEYLKKSARQTEKYAREFLDGYSEYSLGEDMQALWRTALRLPDDIGFDLIENLPVKAGFMSESDLPLDDISKISSVKMSHLLYRDDVAINDIRRKIYTEETDEDNESLRVASVSSFLFKLEDDDFRRLEIKENDSEEEGKKKLKELKLLANFCNGASLAQMEAIIDLVELVPDEYYPGLSHSGEVVGFARRLQQARIAKLDDDFEYELLEWRIYALSSYLIGGYAPSSFNFLKSDIVANDRWGTYLKIRSKIINKTKLHSDLPVLELDDKSYPTISVNDEAEDNHEGEAAPVTIQPPSWQPHIEKIEKRIKWIFWILIILLFLILLQS